MDIRTWLADIELPERPPTLSEQLGLPPFLHPKGESPKEVRRRKRSTSDSSLLDTRPGRQIPPSIRHGADIDDSAEDSACSHATSALGDSAGNSKSSHPYARRPRRKTRLERYEPTSKDVKGRGKQVYQTRSGESRKTRRKSRRKKADQGVGLVQSFHAKNVPRDRLTLKPREKLGIFNKGRASSPVKGRGLPDLVFSEMKFLQKNKGQPEAVPQAGLPMKKRKKDHAQAKQEEISAYFTSLRPVLAEKDANIQAKGGSCRQSLVRDLDHEHKRSSLIDNAVPTVELPDKEAYLRVGGRVARHESGSYVSWSESVRPSSPTIFPRAGSTIDVGKLAAILDRRDGERMYITDPLHSRPDASSIARHITDGSGGCFEISSLAPANHQASRSHSLPQRTSSPRASNTVDRARRSNRKGDETIASPASTQAAIPQAAKPSGIIAGCPNVKNSIGLENTAHSPKKTELVHDNHADELAVGHTEMAVNTIEPPSSSSLGRILQECNSAFDEGRRRVVASYGYNSLHVEPRLDSEKETASPQLHRVSQRTPAVRFTGVEIGQPHRPNFSRPSIYEEQAERQYLMQQQHAIEYEPEHDAYTRDDKCIVDDGDDEGNYYGLDLGYPPEEITSYDFGADVAEDDLASPHGIDRGGESFVQRDGVVVEGFWRPHKLY
ncbi:uncharacterized protein BDR25DRAFT_344409 [Lindgomyces ingoldianus]|uniref:Uncharacterized protein n=1 Tax=Lindgomyces ingoldianus TaxID=673940 RepID=A0ACB6QNE5_9PLEO|nr:uncharacterized protein BDR25DRAFT_344409 [Lindgomyces ingoldianus]KAF2468098.1 hypothetical protein BDR25DRAFT_344409 [Lindgomyces ingoldianus]